MYCLSIFTRRTLTHILICQHVPKDTQRFSGLRYLQRSTWRLVLCESCQQSKTAIQPFFKEWKMSQLFGIFTNYLNPSHLHLILILFLPLIFLMFLQFSNFLSCLFFFLSFFLWNFTSSFPSFFTSFLLSLHHQSFLSFNFFLSFFSSFFLFSLCYFLSSSLNSFFLLLLDL